MQRVTVLYSVLLDTTTRCNKYLVGHCNTLQQVSCYTSLEFLVTKVGVVLYARLVCRLVRTRLKVRIVLIHRPHTPPSYTLIHLDRPP